MSTKVILRFTGGGKPPAADIDRLRSLDDCQVVDVSGRMVLVETGKLSAVELHDEFPEWTAAELTISADPPVTHPGQNLKPKQQS